MREKLQLVSKIAVLPCLLCWCAVISVQAQSREAYTISARAGGVNFVSGNVTVRRRDTTQAQPLQSSDELNAGDTVQTGANSQLEILLNPGSYLRLAENSEIELTDHSLDNLRLRINAGNAIIEATGTDRNHPLAEITTPQTRVAVIRDGLYRISVHGASIGMTEVFVRRGRALVGTNAQPTLVKGGKRALVSGTAAIDVAKFNRRNKDAFDLWSRERGQTLARENRRLSNRDMNLALASFGGFDSLFDASRPYRASGLWVRGSNGCYTYLPFFAGAYSPYGNGYHNSLIFTGASGACCGNRGGQIVSGGSSGGQTGAGGGGAGGNIGGGNGGGSPSPIISRPDPPVRDFPSEPRQESSGRPGERVIATPVRDQ